MGNAVMLLCPVSEFQQLSSLALDICPVPSYEPNPLIKDLLVSPNSSLHLSERYRDVQNSLSPSELARFTRRLRTTFGREGLVTAGGVGVVALALAVLFDTLAKEVKGQWVPRSGPIPGLFSREPGRPLLPPMLLVSDYLRLVPNIANNPARMREETDTFFRKLQEMRKAYLEILDREGVSYVDVFNSYAVWKIVLGIYQYDMFLSNSTRSIDLQRNFYLCPYLCPNGLGGGRSPWDFVSSFNCDLKDANAAFKQEVLERNELREELKRCGIPMEDQATEGLFPEIEFVFLALMELNAFEQGKLVAPGEDFDLKAKSHLPF